MSRTKPAAERRAELLSAAQRLFVDQGVGPTSLEDITTSAGVSKGLFYLYFRSKEDLVAALQDQLSDQIAQRVRDAVSKEPRWPEKLDACVQASFECYREHHLLHEVLFRHLPAPGLPGAAADDAPCGTPLSIALRSLLEEGIAAGALSVTDPAVTAGLLFVTMHAFDPGLQCTDGAADERLMRATQELFRRVAGITEGRSGRSN